MSNYARFEGGPLDGQLHQTPDEIWPLPGELRLALTSPSTTFAMGRYWKTNESQLSDEQVDHPSLGRGATFVWQDGDHETAAPVYREAWNESTGEGVDLSADLDTLEDPKAPHAGARGRLEAALGRARPDYDPRTDYPERFTEGPI